MNDADRKQCDLKDRRRRSLPPRTTLRAWLDSQQLFAGPTRTPTPNNIIIAPPKSSRPLTLFRLPLRPPFAPFARRILIRIGRFLRWPQRFGHVAEVHADASPCGRPAPH